MGILNCFLVLSTFFLLFREFFFLFKYSLGISRHFLHTELLFYTI